MVEQLDLFETSDKEQLLTPRQWALWRLIKHNSLIEHRKTSQKEICEKIPDYVWNDDEKCHDHCPAIWTDVNANNESGFHDKIIIPKNFEYWIGSKEETERYIRRLWRAIAPRLHRYWNVINKTKLDGTGKLLNNAGNPIEEEDTKVKMFHECFNDYDVEMQKAISEEGEEK